MKPAGDIDQASPADARAMILEDIGWVILNDQFASGMMAVLEINQQNGLHEQVESR
jgi:hypothetical protein